MQGTSLSDGVDRQAGMCCNASMCARSDVCMCLCAEE